MRKRAAAAQAAAISSASSRTSAYCGCFQAADLALQVRMLVTWPTPVGMPKNSV